MTLESGLRCPTNLPILEDDPDRWLDECLCRLLIHCPRRAPAERLLLGDCDKQFDVHPNQITSWKRNLKGASLMFSDLSAPPRQKLVDPLHLVVGDVANTTVQPSLRIDAIALG